MGSLLVTLPLLIDDRTAWGLLADRSLLEEFRLFCEEDRLVPPPLDSLLLRKEDGAASSSPPASEDFDDGALFCLPFLLDAVSADAVVSIVTVDSFPNDVREEGFVLPLAVPPRP